MARGAVDGELERRGNEGGRVEGRASYEKGNR